MKPKKQPAPAITAARQPTWRCAAIPTLSGCRPWRRLPITFRFPPLPRKRGRAVETHKKAACTWFFNVQAAFYALCSLCGELLVHRPPAPSPVGEGWGEGFSDCLPTCGRAAAQRVGMAAIRHALPLNFCARSGVPSPTEEGGWVAAPQKYRYGKQPAPCFFAYNTPCPTPFRYSGNWI